jgi:DNA polymerase IV (DinB-like DNA polymerase)
MPSRIVGHLDMDAFFAAVEERDRPELRGLPIVVGADPLDGRGRGVVSTANYKARKYGIHSAMPISKAWRLSEAARVHGKPPVVFVRPNFHRYSEVSERIAAILRSHAPVIEQSGIDEAYFELSFAGSYAEAESICRKIKDEVKDREGLTASVGIGPNKLVAKIASDFRKPDALTVVEEKEAEAFLAPLPVRKIPGIGPKTEAFLKGQGIGIVRDLKKITRDRLQELFGKWGWEMYDRIRGRDDSPLQEWYEPKSVGEQETFLKDTLDPVFLMERIARMCQNVARRFLEEGFKTFRTVVLTVRFEDFETKTRSHTLAAPAISVKELESEAMKLFEPFLDRRENPKSKLIRLVGVRVEKIEK